MLDLASLINQHMRENAMRRSVQDGRRASVRQTTAAAQTGGAVNPAAAGMLQSQAVADYNARTAGQIANARAADEAAKIQAGVQLGGTLLNMFTSGAAMGLGGGGGGPTGAVKGALGKPSAPVMQQAMGGVTQGQPASAEGVGVQRSMVTSAPQELPMPAQPATPAAQPGVLPEQQGSLPGFNPMQLRQPMVPAGDRGYVTPMVPIEDPVPEEQDPTLTPFLMRRLRLGQNFGLR